MAAGRTFLRQEELSTEKAMDGLPRARKRELQRDHRPGGSIKKARPFLVGLEIQINPIGESYKNEAIPLEPSLQSIPTAVAHDQITRSEKRG